MELTRIVLQKFFSPKRRLIDFIVDQWNREESFREILLLKDFEFLHRVYRKNILYICQF